MIHPFSTLYQEVAFQDRRAESQGRLLPPANLAGKRVLTHRVTLSCRTRHSPDTPGDNDYCVGFKAQNTLSQCTVPSPATATAAFTTSRPSPGRFKTRLLFHPPWIIQFHTRYPFVEHRHPSHQRPPSTPVLSLSPFPTIHQPTTPALTPTLCPPV